MIKLKSLLYLWSIQILIFQASNWTFLKLCWLCLILKIILCMSRNIGLWKQLRRHPSTNQLQTRSASYVAYTVTCLPSASEWSDHMHNQGLEIFFCYRAITLIWMAIIFILKLNYINVDEV